MITNRQRTVLPGQIKRMAFKIQPINYLLRYKEYLKNDLKVWKDIEQEETSQKEKALNYLETITGQKPGDNRTKTGRNYTNGSLKSISDIIILTIKNINSSTKAKTLKNSF